MRKISRLILLLTLLAACNRQNHFVKSSLETTEKFFACLKDNTPDRILDYTYPGIDPNIDNKEMRENSVRLIAKLINKHGLPSKRKWIITYDPKNNFERLKITLRLFKGYDSENHIRQCDIVVFSLLLKLVIKFTSMM